MKILLLGYSDLCKRKIIPMLNKNFSRVKFCICSKTQKKKNIGAYEWYRNYESALKNSNADIVYVSLRNSEHYYWAKKSLEKKYHVIIDKPASLNFKQAKILVKIAKRKKRLLSEAVVFNYHHQIDKAIKEVKSIRNLIHVEARFVIPGFSKNNWHNFKKYGGGCLMDMGPYAAATFRVFTGKNNKQLTLSTFCQENKHGTNVSFSVEAVSRKKSFSGYFSHNGEYENNIILFTKQKSVKINRAFSPPNDMDLTLEINKGNISKKRKLKSDDTFFNYFKKIIILLKTKKFETSYQDLLTDSFFREKLCLKKNIIKI